MPHERVVLLEDNPVHAYALSKELLTEGYQIEIVATIDEAVQVLASGVGKAIIDLRLAGRFDNSGLQAVGRIKRKFPSTFVVVCSEIADQWRDWAFDEGADAVVVKLTAQMRVSALEIVTHFLRHDGGRGMIRFLGEWIGLPTLLGIGGSWALWQAGFNLPVFGPARTVFLPFLAALLFVLTVSVSLARRERPIARNEIFLAFLMFRWWLVSALAGGFTYEVLSRILKS